MKFSHKIANDMLSTIGEEAKNGTCYTEKGRGRHRLEGTVHYKITAVKNKDGMDQFTLVIRDLTKTVNRSLVVIADGDDIQLIKADIKDKTIQAYYEIGNPYRYPNFGLSLVRGEVGYRTRDGLKITRSVSCDLNDNTVDILDISEPAATDVFYYCAHGGQAGIDPNHITDDGMRMGDVLFQGLRYPRLNSTLKCVDKVACTGFHHLKNIIDENFESYDEILNGEYQPLDRIDNAFKGIPPIKENHQLPDDKYIKELLWVPKKFNTRG